MSNRVDHILYYVTLGTAGVTLVVCGIAVFLSVVTP